MKFQISRFKEEGKFRKTFGWIGGLRACRMIKMSEQEDWSEKDATWELLGKAAPRKVSGCFADDTLRAVKLLPEADPWWPSELRFSPWAAFAACGALAALFFLNPQVENDLKPVGGKTGTEEQWAEIEAVAEEEMLAAAAEHLDRFSDQELVTLIGF